MQYPTHGYQQSDYIPPHRFVKYSWIAEAWSVYRSGWIPWLVLYLVIGGPVILADVGLGFSIHSMSGSSSGSDSDPGPAFDAGIFMCVIGMALSLAFLNFCVVCCSTGIAARQVRGDQVRASDIFVGLNRWIAMIILNVLLALCLTAGIMVFGCGLFVVSGLLMPAFAMVADGERPFKAISKSISVMKSDWIQASLFCFVFALISILASAATLGLGLLVVLPMAYIISALAHRDSAIQARHIDLEQPSRWGQDVWPPAPQIYQQNPVDRPAEPNQDQH
jgi:hypothetical protein